MAKKHKRISALNFSDAIQESLSEYGSDAALVLRDSIQDVTERAAQKLQQVQRFAEDGHPTGEYSRDWDSSFYKTAFTSHGTVYNVDNYRLTHLLEFGHVNRNGTGRTDMGSTPAYPHIAPVNEWAQKEVYNDVTRRLEKL